MYTLRPYQREAVEVIKSNKFSLIADEVGLGKTFTAIQAAKELGAVKILVLCPAALTANWISEFAKFWPDVEPLRVTSALRVFPNIAVASYDYAKLAKARFIREYDYVILDEAHGYRSHKSARTRAILGKGGVLSKAARVVALTATPIEKSAADLWPLLYSQKVVKDTFYQFIYRYCEIQKTPFADVIKGTRDDRLEEFKALLNPVMLRRMKKDVEKDLPELNFYSVVVEPGKVDLANDMPNMTKKLNAAAMVKEAVGIVSKSLEYMTYADLTKHGAAFMEINHYNALSKVDATIRLAKERLEETATNKVVIFSNFTKPINKIAEGLKEYGANIIDGSTAKSRVGEIVHAFQNDDSRRALVCNIAAAGAGLTLTAADYELFNDISLSATANTQALGRCHRIGTKADVSAVAVTLSDNGVDKRIFQLVKGKMDEQAKILN